VRHVLTIRHQIFTIHFSRSLTKNISGPGRSHFHITNPDASEPNKVVEIWHPSIHIANQTYISLLAEEDIRGRRPSALYGISVYPLPCRALGLVSCCPFALLRLMECRLGTMACISMALVELDLTCGISRQPGISNGLPTPSVLLPRPVEDFTTP